MSEKSQWYPKMVSRNGYQITEQQADCVHDWSGGGLRCKNCNLALRTFQLIRASAPENNLNHGFHFPITSPPNHPMCSTRCSEEPLPVPAIVQNEEVNAQMFPGGHWGDDVCNMPKLDLKNAPQQGWRTIVSASL